MVKEIVKMVAQLLAILFLAFVVGSAVVGLLVGMVNHIMGQDLTETLEKMDEPVQDIVLYTEQQTNQVQVHKDLMSITRNGAHIIIDRGQMPASQVQRVMSNVIRRCARYTD